MQLPSLMPRNASSGSQQPNQVPSTKRTGDSMSPEEAFSMPIQPSPTAKTLPKTTLISLHALVLPLLTLGWHWAIVYGTVAGKGNSQLELHWFIEACLHQAILKIIRTALWNRHAGALKGMWSLCPPLHNNQVSYIAPHVSTKIQKAMSEVNCAKVWS